MDEDYMLRQAYPLYDAFCREDEGEEQDPYEAADAEWERQDGR